MHLKGTVHWRRHKDKWERMLQFECLLFCKFICLGLNCSAMNINVWHKIETKQNRRQDCQRKIWAHTHTHTHTQIPTHRQSTWSSLLDVTLRSLCFYNTGFQNKIILSNITLLKELIFGVQCSEFGLLTNKCELSWYICILQSQKTTWDIFL